MIIQFHIRRRVDLYDRSHHYPIPSSTQSTHYSISLDSSVSYYAEITPIRSVTSVSYLLFVIYHILSNWSCQFNFHFHRDHTCMMIPVVVLSSLHHRSFLVESVMKIQICFQLIVDLYDRSRRCPISSLSQIAHYAISLDNSISYFAEITLILSVTSSSCLIFVIDYTYTISHVFALYSLLHKPYPIELDKTVEFLFWCKANLYD